MCLQTYHSYARCPCQIRGMLYRCKLDDEAKCRYVRKQVVDSGLPFCSYHKVVARDRKGRLRRYWDARGRKLWPAPKPRPLRRSTFSRATVADTEYFPQEHHDPYDSSSWEDGMDTDESDGDDDWDFDEVPGLRVVGEDVPTSGEEYTGDEMDIDG
ncbi:hypothetical protein Daesc_009278 [Daldinia eschscholtzii]|uniref:Uncharacterized protein n=1 Tax=Daldinia eschscholtzii TaxID=292717 RepID=A0AAX6M9R7_9PEZI